MSVHGHQLITTNCTPNVDWNTSKFSRDLGFVNIGSAGLGLGSLTDSDTESKMPVVYNGVEGISQGDLFQGLKLWISHLVPLRSKWVDLVEVSFPTQTSATRHFI